ncbi:MAG: hypothetical protein JEZ14_21105 [Marinilabiliaceae bacterium]|nr:hypothetical protein [Marinilabiliaceae bacterium]
MEIKLAKSKGVLGILSKAFEDDLTGFYKSIANHLVNCRRKDKLIIEFEADDHSFTLPIIIEAHLMEDFISEFKVILIAFECYEELTMLKKAGI